MPLTINVGLSRKSSENYQSRGVSINVSAELDQSLLADPHRLQREIAGLYVQAEEALEEQCGEPNGVTNGRSESRAPRDRDQRRSDRGRNDRGDRDDDRSNGNRSSRSSRANGNPSNGNGGGNHRPATNSQIRALRAIADRLNVNLGDEVEDQFDCQLDALDVPVHALQFLTITKAKSPKVQLHVISASDEKLAATLDQVREVWRGIEAGVFPPRPGWTCRTCPFQSQCDSAAI